MRWRELIGDVIGCISVFALLYLSLFIPLILGGAQ